MRKLILGMAMVLACTSLATIHARASLSPSQSVSVKQKSKAKFFQSLANIPDLTASQKEEIYKIHEKYVQKNRNLKNELQASISHLPVDEQRKAMQDQRAYRSELAQKNRIEEMNEIAQVLTPDQQRYFRNMLQNSEYKSTPNK